jgi:DNA-binding IclR family transcriptional regulator
VLAAYNAPLTQVGARIRTECFAVSMGERDPACAGLASPIFGPDGSIRGALSLSGPKERFTTAAIEKMRRLLLAAAMSVTRQLGGVSAIGS